MISKTNRLLGAILLVSGTTIGAGMLALPLITGQAGFFPSLALMTGTWLFMLLTAFYLLEVNLRLPGETNLITMVRITLGRPGEIVAWTTYLLLLYSLLAAYMVGCSEILAGFLGRVFPEDVPDWVWTLGVFIAFACFVYFGTEVVDFCNRILMFGLVAGYFALMIFGMKFVHFPLLLHAQWPFLLGSVSVIVTSFGFHIIIPTLSTYLEHDVRLLKAAIFWGSFIPFLIYLLWQLVVMGILPPAVLEQSATEGKQIVFFLQKVLKSPWLGLMGRLFTLFAILTSLLGISLSLSDFLADGLNIKKTRLGKLLLVLLTFVPPLLFALLYPKGFILALRYAGIFVIVLLALLPSLMVWSERYGAGAQERGLIKPTFQVLGRKGLVIAAFLIALTLLGIEVLA